MFRVFLLLLVFILGVHEAIFKKATVIVEDADYWNDLGMQELKAKLEIEANLGIAKNVILFIGDGMGISTVTAARIYKGQKNEDTGEEGYLDFERFENVGLVKTYNTDKQVPDSAGTATAILTGVKTRYYMLGLDSKANFNVCDATLNERAHLTSIATWAQKEGKDTGLVTTTRVTHATPAALYSHSNNRDWECDTKLPPDAKSCKDIARQLVEDEPGKNFKVILAGGQKQMIAGTQNNDSSCSRGDGKNLVEAWKDDKKQQHFSYQYVSTADELTNVDISKTDYLLGLFSPSHMNYETERNTSKQPSLAKMTRQAIKMLQKNKKGYFLLVEGGRIDHAHHQNLAMKSLEEVLMFNEAINVARDMTNSKDTLIVVTADHSHSFTINGYPGRGNPILGFGGNTSEGIPYETLSYANGPSFTYHRLYGHDNQTWKNLSLDTTRESPEYGHFSPMPLDDETHGGEDVAVYAHGPMGHLVRGVHEQTHTTFVMSYAACIGPAKELCSTTKRLQNSAATMAKHQILILGVFLVLLKLV